MPYDTPTEREVRLAREMSSMVERLADSVNTKVIASGMGGPLGRSVVLAAVGRRLLAMAGEMEGK